MKHLGKINGTYNEEVKSFGYSPLEEIKYTDKKYKVIDSNGFFYSIRLTGLRSGYSPSAFGKTNLYSKDNVALMMQKKGFEIDVLGVAFDNVTKIKCLCRKCGYRWTPQVHNLFKDTSKGCPICSNKANYIPFKYVLKRFNDKYKNKFEYKESSYLGMEKQMKIICPEHGEFHQTPADHLTSKYGCYLCSLSGRGVSSMKSEDELINNISETNKENEVVNIYRQDGVIKVDYICHYCKSLAKGININFLYAKEKRGCKMCLSKRSSETQALGAEEALRRLQKMNNKISFNTEKYENNKSIIKCKCLLCGNTWESKYMNLMKVSRCPKCSKKTVKNDGGYNITVAERNKMEWEREKAIVYVIRISDEREKFYKIGISKPGTISERMKRIGASYECLEKLSFYNTNLYMAIYLEKLLHIMHSEYKYQPLQKFSGYTECFSRVDLEKIRQQIDLLDL